MNPPANPPNTHPKITSIHLQRLAYVYVRQSSPKQVAQNKESQQYQYRLQQRAVELGWPAEQVRVVDSDQARSAREATARTGFQELVAARIGPAAEVRAALAAKTLCWGPMASFLAFRLCRERLAGFKKPRRIEFVAARATK